MIIQTCTLIELGYAVANKNNSYWENRYTSLSKLENEYQKAEEDVKQIIWYSHIEELTQEVVDAFIKKIYAYKDKRVEIEWNFSMDRGSSQAKIT